MKTYFQRMLRYVEWANREMIQALEFFPIAQTKALPILEHILAAEHVWYSRILGKPPDLPVWPRLDLIHCKSLSIQNSQGYGSLLLQKSGDDFHDGVKYQNTKGESFETSHGDMLSHVVNHGTYHRGQMAKIMGQLAGKPPVTDFIAFARMHSS